MPSTTRDIGEQLSQQHAAQKVKNRQVLYQILSIIQYLCRQGLPLREDNDETDSNFKQLLLMKAENDLNLALWLQRKENVYTSEDIQNEMLKVMGLQVLREVSADLHASPFLTIMADETTKEQVTLILRSANNELEVHKEFLRLYHVAAIDAATLTAAIKDALVRMNLPFDNIRGQCYDGCNAMSSSKCGVSK